MSQCNVTLIYLSKSACPINNKTELTIMEEKDGRLLKINWISSVCEVRLNVPEYLI